MMGRSDCAQVLRTKVETGPARQFFDEQLATSRLLFLAEFLESGIAAQRVPERIKPEKGRRNGRWVVIRAPIRRL